MNERIRELAKQAGGYVSLSYEHDGKLILSGEDTVKKFAELIIAECILAHEDNYGGDIIGDVLKEHFGIKE